MSAGFVELCAHSWYSFGAGASSPAELVDRAGYYGYQTLGLTDVSNLCGALDFVQECRSAGIGAVLGADLTVREGDRMGPVTFIAENGAGYSNLCRLISLAYVTGGRTTPVLDVRFLEPHAEGLIALLGDPDGLLAADISAGHWSMAEGRAKQYAGCFGAGSVFLGLQQHLAHGDTVRNERMSQLAERCRLGCVATNAPWYHDTSRARLHDSLTAMRMNSSLSEIRNSLKVNCNYDLQTRDVMEQRLRKYPESLTNTLVLAERCSNFSALDFVTSSYRFPDVPTPPGHDAQSWLERLCEESAARRYGGIDRRVRERLDEEFELIRKHGLAGFFLVYHRVVELAREVMLELGWGHQETPLEWLPPGRGRGSSVSMLVGYLIGLSHVDPLDYGLALDRFLSSESTSMPDIDLDFPRDIRERLILRIIEEWGWDHAVLTGMFPTYKARGVIRGLGKALGLPPDEVGALARRVDSNSVWELPQLPGYAELVKRPGWDRLFALADSLQGFPKGVAQHPGGMLLSSTALTDFMPVQPAAIAGRYIGQWDKESVDDAGMVKIDLLALGALSQLQQAVRLVRNRTGVEPDLSRIDYREKDVFDDLGRGDTVGVFQVESAAQMQTIVRMHPEDIYELALEIAAVRPGVGAHDGVAEFLRRRKGFAWDYAHPLERAALERSLGVIMFQDQVVQLGMDIGGFTAADADRMRRAFGRRNGSALVAEYRQRFLQGARERDVPEKAAEAIFGKFNPHYMFPEGHALAFAFTAYQMAWLRRHYPLEFYVGLFNEQPMGFWDLDTLKQDARRINLRVAHPDINRSQLLSTAEGERTLRLGLTFVKGVDRRLGEILLHARDAGEFGSLADVLARSGLPRQALENLARAGAMDRLPDCTDRGSALWQIGSGYVPDARRGQLALPMAVAEAPAAVVAKDRSVIMLDEYDMMGLCPDGHIMELARHELRGVHSSDTLQSCCEGDVVRVAGRVVRRQRPLAKAVFLTLEDEFGLIPVAVWEQRWETLKHVLRRPLVVIEGEVSRRDNTLNVMAERAWPLRADLALHAGSGHDWR